jgi:hypothetical protein
MFTNSMAKSLDAYTSILRQRLATPGRLPRTPERWLGRNTKMISLLVL